MAPVSACSHHNSDRAGVSSSVFRKRYDGRGMIGRRKYEMQQRTNKQQRVGLERKAMAAVGGLLSTATLAHPALAQGLNPLLPHNLSPWGMFLNADIVVKAVMIGLAFASLVTWTVWLAKTIEV